MRAGTHNAGFTLVELMIVVVIIGIATSVMVAEMQGSFEDALLKGTARKLIDACDVASQRAIAVGRSQVLKIDVKGGRFAVEGKAGEESGIDTAGGAGELDTRVSIVVKEPSSDEAEMEEEKEKGPMEAITFYADGSCEAREFLLRDRAGFELALRINPITSRVRILEEAPR